MKSKNIRGKRRPDRFSGQKANLDWKRILVPLDFSDSSFRALDYAIPLARRSGGKLVLLHVIQVPVMPTPAVSVGGIGEVKEAHKALRQHAKVQLETLTKQTGAAGLVTHKLVTIGVAWDEIVKAAKRLECDLVVMSTHGHSGIRRMLAAHNAERVVNLANCPVLCVRG
jgi:nucleotide-binding universal stress UspA family protein